MQLGRELEPFGDARELPAATAVGQAPGELDALAVIFLIALPLVLAGFGAALAWRRRRR